MDFAQFVATSSACAPSGDDSRRYYETIINQTPQSAAPLTVGQKQRQTTTRCRKTVPFQRSVLFRAASDGDLITLRSMQAPRNASDINAVDQFGWNALMMAAWAGHPTVVQYLLKMPNIDVNATERSSLRHTALSLAVKGRHKHIEALLADRICEAQQQQPATVVISDSEEDEKSDMRHANELHHEQFFCPDCARSFSNSGTRAQHEASILHRFNIRSKLQPLAKRYALPDSNRGFRLMLKQGWDREHGLGPTNRLTAADAKADDAQMTTMALGPSFPIKTTLRQGRSGLGVPQPPSRITHFLAHDRSAIIDRRRQPKPRPLRVVTKRQLGAQVAHRRQEERRLRRALD